MTRGAGVSVGSGVGATGEGGAWMAMGAGVGTRHKKVIPPNRMALISAPANAEFQCQRTREDLGEADFTDGVAGGFAGGDEGEVGMNYGSDVASVWRAKTI